jgi:hypothetical protein
VRGDYRPAGSNDFHPSGFALTVRCDLRPEDPAAPPRPDLAPPILSERSLSVDAKIANG